jgi:hypothetical protein
MAADKPRVTIRKTADGWEVVEPPEELSHEEYTETIAATPRPSEPDDPRTGNERRLPGLPGGIG